MRHAIRGPRDVYLEIAIMEFRCLHPSSAMRVKHDLPCRKLSPGLIKNC